jgi:hypothetical protein
MAYMNNHDSQENVELSTSVLFINEALKNTNSLKTVCHSTSTIPCTFISTNLYLATAVLFFVPCITGDNNLYS